MSRIFVLTLGFEEKFPLRAVVRHGIEEGDLLVVVTGPFTDKTRRALESLKDIVEKIAGSGVEVRVLELEPSCGFTCALAKIYDELAKLGSSDSEVVASLSGGMRVAVLAAFAAMQLLSLRGRRVKVELETEDSSMLLEVPQPILRLHRLAADLTEEKLRLLGALVPEATVEELARATGRNTSTVRRHLKRLEAEGLVAPKGKRPKKYALTPEGLLLLKVLHRSTATAEQLHEAAL